ncbi:aminoglycoside phosphotransferase family protein [Umezawaea sp. NPDC059074]|uniref:aminoglycoside phosphotransferase family protein n=1 Tax=Umezawaea sp. NPDC059074 TaxID=3346716 RepID=UPI003691ADF7
MTTRMHVDEVDVGPDLVRDLIARRFPRWAGLDVRPVASTGTDNAVFRLGDHLVARLPRIRGAHKNMALDQRWLPVLAPHLPVAIPEPVGLGEPDLGYPWAWSVYRWLPGEHPTAGAADGLVPALAEFVTALRAVDTTDAPPAGRGRPLAGRDTATRAAIASLAGQVHTPVVTAAWEHALTALAWTGPPVWVHGDLTPGNLLTTDGALSGVIDFGATGVGDPACDLLVAWNLLTADGRARLRDALDVDDAQWARGRGWALTVALIALPYYRDTNPALAASSRHVIEQVTIDHITSGCR